MKIDGLTASSTPSTYPGSINSRLSVPSYIDFDINMVGDASGGTGYYSITAEQDPGVSGQIKVWSVVIQNDFIAAGTGWGGYTGMEMMWMPVAWPLGVQGQVISFTGPYPQTVDLMGTYTLNPAQHIFDKLKVVTFVQLSSGTREVLNASHMDLPDTPTGIWGTESGPAGEYPLLHVGPSPTPGQITVNSALPEGQTGTVQIFDLRGRAVQSFAAQGSISAFIEEAGVYFVRLITSGGEAVNRRVVVVR